MIKFGKHFSFEKDILKIQLSVQNLDRFSINGLLHFESTADQTDDDKFLVKYSVSNDKLMI